MHRSLATGAESLTLQLSGMRITLFRPSRARAKDALCFRQDSIRSIESASSSKNVNWSLEMTQTLSQNGPAIPQSLKSDRLMPIRIPATASRPSIVVILPRGEAIRNVVYSGTLDQLSAAANLTALSVFPSEDIRRFMEQSCTVQPLRNVPERYVVGALREVLDMAHGRHLWSKAAQERWMVRDSEATTVALK